MPSRTPTPTPLLTTGLTICNGGINISQAFIKASRLGFPLGDEKIVIRGTLVFGPGVPATFDPSSRGAQIRIDDLGSGGSAIFELSYLTKPIPPGPQGTGCNARDGWKSDAPGRYLYKNRSGAIDPPACTPGSAKGLSLLKLMDLRAIGDGVPFIAKARNASLPAPSGPLHISLVGPLRISLVLGATAGASNAGECGTYTFSPGDCVYGHTLTAMICR